MGIKTGDTEAEAKKLADKITELRVFEDGKGKMELLLRDAGGSLLLYPNLPYTVTASMGGDLSF